MSFDNNKISQGLSFQYGEKQKLKKSNYKNINDMYKRLRGGK